MVASVLALSACEKGLPEVTLEEGERIAQIAEPAAAELLRTLVGRLTSALAEGGAAQAMELCSTEAMSLTRFGGSWVGWTHVSQTHQLPVPKSRECSR